LIKSCVVAVLLAIRARDPICDAGDIAFGIVGIVGGLIVGGLSATISNLGDQVLVVVPITGQSANPICRGNDIAALI
jgi:hypothetical protein